MPATPNLTPGEAVARQVITAYTLSPAQSARAEALHRTGLVLSFGSLLLGFLVLWLMLRRGFGPALRSLAARVSSRLLVQSFIVASLMTLTLAVVELPLALWAHRTALDFGLSVQGWGGWLADWSKEQLISCLLGGALLWLLCLLMRGSPRRWWLYGWLLSLPILSAMVFAAPVLLDPIFNRFEPLAQSHPELTRQLQSLARRSGMEIPESRIFLMHASDKVTTYNAYVTGFGATKRIVVWDTTARDMTVPQTLFVFGHEMGHYVLHHIYKGMAFTALLLLLGFYLNYRISHHLLARYGKRWKMESLDAQASLPLLLLVASLLSFIATPAGSAFSRWEEHQADAYGLAITRGFTADSAQVAAQSFQLLGERGLSVLHPSPLLVFWSYSHPPIPDRIRFALSQEKGALR